MRSTLLMSALALGASAPAAPVDLARQPTTCETILPLAKPQPHKRALTPQDLARLRDIGPSEPQYFGSPAFTISPEGARAAFQLRQADPKQNNHCLAIVILDLSGSAKPQVIDEGGEPILATIDLRGVVDIPSGLFRPITPRWSKDGKWVAFLKRTGSTTQVWRAFADGAGSSPLTHSDVDVVDFRIGADGSSIIFATRPDIDRQRREIERESLNGWHYDDRFSPFYSKRPLPIGPAERRASVVDARTGRVRPATASEAAQVAAGDEFPAHANAGIPTNVDGLEIAATNLSATAKRGALSARLGDGNVASCTAAPCEGAINPWWTPDRRHVRFRRWEGWANASTAIYDWDVKTGAVRRLHATDDLLTSCASGLGAVICLRHSSLVPGQLVRLDAERGTRQVLFDLNPEVGSLRLGRVERLHWRNAFGVETVGDLVFPVDYRPGRKYPMVVVQYDTRGFLRGGTDDEYPIQAFANRDYAVLSFKRPAMPSAKVAKDFEEAGRLNLQQFADRRSVQSSLEGGDPPDRRPWNRRPRAHRDHGSQRWLDHGRVGADS